MDPSKVIDVAERSQGLWEKGWQSGTAGILLAVFLTTLALLLRSQHLRVKDREAADKRIDAQTGRLDALVRETAAQVGENGKQLFVFAHEAVALRASIEELRRNTERELAEMRRALERRIRKPPGAAP